MCTYNIYLAGPRAKPRLEHTYSRRGTPARHAPRHAWSTRCPFNAKSLLGDARALRRHDLCAAPTVCAPDIQARIWRPASASPCARVSCGAGEPLISASHQQCPTKRDTFGPHHRDGYGTQTETTAIVANSPGQKVKHLARWPRPDRRYRVLISLPDGMRTQRGRRY